MGFTLTRRKVYFSAALLAPRLSLFSACLSTTTEGKMLAGAGCVSSPMATSCYSDGPELIGDGGDDGEAGKPMEGRR